MNGSFIDDQSLCAPTSNRTLDRLFSQIHLIKMNVQNQLKNDTLNALLQIQISYFSLETFH